MLPLSFRKYMKKICLGDDEDGNKVMFDFDEESINFILLIGQTGSGKGIFHLNLYKELSEKYSSDEIGFLFLDMTRVDFCQWSSDYLIRPTISDPQKAIAALHELADLETDKKIFVHIEECDMVYIDREGLESAFRKLRERENVYIVFSTSRINKEYFSNWMKDFIDLKVVFTVMTEDDSVFLLGSDAAYNFKKPGESILAFNDKQVFCQPFSKEEVKLLNKFKL